MLTTIPNQTFQVRLGTLVVGGDHANHYTKPDLTLAIYIYCRSNFLILRVYFGKLEYTRIQQEAQISPESLQSKLQY